MRRVYLDYAATTPLDEKVLESMKPYFLKQYGNASSLHSYGLEAKKALEKSREEVATFIGGDPDEIIFTGSGTESDNLAIQGIAFRAKKGHIITSSVEHPGVLETCRSLEKKGFRVTYLPVDKYGIVDPAHVKDALREDTVLITIMHANNEIGTIEPIEEIGKIASKNNIPFHTDAVQTLGKIPIDVQKMNVDLLSVSSHKMYGPKGVGALYVKKPNNINALMFGGGHERGVRPSTENIPGIVGFAKACALAKERMKDDMKKMRRLRDTVIKGALEIQESYLNGHPERRLPNNAHFYFKGIEGESLILMLDDAGIAASTGSACSSKKLTPSHVLLAIGLKPEEAHGSLRLTLGRTTDEADIGYVLETLPGIVKQLREISPTWLK